MIIFKGYGIVVMLFIVGSAFLANLLTNAISGNDTYWGKHAWLVGVAQIFAGTLCWLVGIVIERRYSRVFIVEDTGERVIEHHSFFFIPIKWWCPILTMLGLGIILFDITRIIHEDFSWRRFAGRRWVGGGVVGQGHTSGRTAPFPPCENPDCVGVKERLVH